MLEIITLTHSHTHTLTHSHTHTHVHTHTNINTHTSHTHTLRDTITLFYILDSCAYFAYFSLQQGRYNPSLHLEKHPRLHLPHQERLSRLHLHLRNHQTHLSNLSHLLIRQADGLKRSILRLIFIPVLWGLFWETVKGQPHLPGENSSALLLERCWRCVNTPPRKTVELWHLICVNDFQRRLGISS